MALAEGLKVYVFCHWLSMLQRFKPSHCSYALVKCQTSAMRRHSRTDYSSKSDLEAKCHVWPNMYFPKIPRIEIELP